NALVEIDARIQISGIEVQVVDPGFTDSSSFRELQEISLRILKDQSVVPATTQSALTLDVSHERARAADFFLHPLEFGFRNQEGMSRVRSRAVPLGKRRFSLGKESDMVFPQFHENSAHIRSVLSFQSSCSENFGVKLLGPIAIHDRNDKMIKMADITFSCRSDAHTETLLLFTLLTHAKVIEQQPFSKLALSLVLSHDHAGEGRVRGRNVGKNHHLFFRKVERNFARGTLTFRLGLC